MKVHYKVHRDGWRGVFFSIDVSVLDVSNPGDHEAIARACARDFGLPEDWKTPAVFSLHAKEGGPEIARFAVAAARPETIYSAERVS